MQQIDDFRTEVAELAAILAPLPEAAWATPTQFKTYTIADLVRHLHQGDHMALTSAGRPAEFEALLAERRPAAEGPENWRRLRSEGPGLFEPRQLPMERGVRLAAVGEDHIGLVDLPGPAERGQRSGR